MISIGIDPGEGGAMCIMEGDKTSTYKFIDVHDVDRALADVQKNIPTGMSVFAILEQVHAMPKQGVSSTFKFGEYFGLAKGFLIAHQIPFETVTPAKWQKMFQVGKSATKNAHKNKLKAIAQNLVPSQRVTLATADAILLAHYCKKTR